MTADYRDTDSFRGARFEDVDLTGARFFSCDLREVKIADSWLANVSVSGLISNFRVNDVDVVPFVEAELDRRNPERVQRRNMDVDRPDDYREMWETIERVWSDTLARARKLPEPMLHERVDDEWSFVETLRHLVFATDAWVNRAVLDASDPFARLGLTHTDYPRDNALALGIDVDAQPTLDDVLAVRADRVALVRDVVEGLTEDRIAQTCLRTPAPGYPEELPTVGQCVRVVMGEECEHHRYATRDLAVLEAR